MFKIGDRVRLIEDYGGHKKGEEGIVTQVYNTRWYVDGRVAQQLVYYGNMSVFDLHLELVSEPRFEVGKKYRFKPKPTWIIQVTAISKEWMICTELGGYLFRAGTEHAYKLNVIDSWEEYIPDPPKPVHKEGWITMGRDKHIFENKEALDKHIENLGSGGQYIHAAHVTWDETPEASEDDTI